MTLTQETTAGLKLDTFEEAAAALAAVVEVKGEFHPLVDPNAASSLQPSLLQEIKLDYDEEGHQVFEGDEAVVILQSLEAIADPQGPLIYQPIAERMLVEAGIRPPQPVIEKARIPQPGEFNTAGYTPGDAAAAQRASKQIVAHDAIYQAPQEDETTHSRLARVEHAAHNLKELVRRVLPLPGSNTETFEVVGFEDIVTAHRAVIAAAAEKDQAPDLTLVDELEEGMKHFDTPVVLEGKKAAKVRKALEVVAQDGFYDTPKDEAAAYLLRTHVQNSEAVAA
jgi:hypothetical protein